VFTSGFIQHSDIQTAYHDLGRGAPLVFVHGFTGSKLDFTSQLAWFVENHRVISYDHRGHGESSNASPYSLQQLAADLISFLDKLDIPTCHLLGYSLGGMVALRAQLANPERFRSLILMDTAPFGLDLFGDDNRAQLNSIVTQDGCQALLPSMQSQRPNAIAKRGIDFLGETEHWRRIRVKLEQMDPEAFVQLGAELVNQENLLARMADISVPTTIIVGAKDKPFLKPSRAMHKAVADSVLSIIPKAGHSPQYENADQWRDSVLRHLAQ
jgi:3-oxoadipate enol-lactonase